MNDQLKALDIILKLKSDYYRLYLAYDGVETSRMSLPAHQELFKRFSQNVIEEWSELYEYFYLKSPCERKDYIDGMVDEVSDILGFTYALGFLSGVDLTDIKPQLIVRPSNTDYSMERVHFEILVYKNIIHKLSMVCNLLKNRPWKSSQHLLDMPEFEKQFKQFFQFSLKFIVMLQLPNDKLEVGLKRKIEVNYFRIKSNY